MSARCGGLTAWARIRSQDQLEACREASVYLASPERDHARLQGRSERIDDGRLKLRRLLD
jgi:hypothetical protein